MVFQQFNLFERRTALDNVKEGLKIVKKLSDEEATKIAKEELAKVGLSNRENHYPRHLSGGQKQRAVIARIFALDPDIFVLDEPTTGMDAGTANTFYELMHHSAHNHGKSVLMITHDPEEVKEYTDRNIHLVRNQKLPWRCFNIHEKDGEDHKHD